MPAETKEQIHERLSKQADDLDRAVAKEISSYKPVGRVSELGLIMGYKPPANRDIVSTPNGTLVFKKDSSPSAETVKKWENMNKEAGEIRESATLYLYGLNPRPHTTTGNFRVVEHGRKLDTMGLLGDKDKKELRKLEDFWATHPDLDRQKGGGVYDEKGNIQLSESIKSKPKAPISKEYGKLKVGQQIEVETPKGFVKGEITGFRSGDVGEDFMRVDVKTAERPYIGAHPNSIRVPEKAPSTKVQMKEFFEDLYVNKYGLPKPKITTVPDGIYIHYFGGSRAEKIFINEASFKEDPKFYETYLEDVDDRVIHIVEKNKEKPEEVAEQRREKRLREGETEKEREEYHLMGKAEEEKRLSNITPYKKEATNLGDTAQIHKEFVKIVDSMYTHHPYKEIVVEADPNMPTSARVVKDKGKLTLEVHPSFFSISKERQEGILRHEAIHIGSPRHDTQFRMMARVHNAPLYLADVYGIPYSVYKEGVKIKEFKDYEGAMAYAKREANANPGVDFAVRQLPLRTRARKYLQQQERKAQEEIKKEIKEEKQGAEEYKEKAQEAGTPQERKTYESMAKDEERHAKQLESMKKPTKEARLKYKMILDSKGEKGGGLFSGNVVTLRKGFGDKLIAEGRAAVYDEKADAKRIVNVDGKEMTWGEFLKYRKKIMAEGGGMVNVKGKEMTWKQYLKSRREPKEQVARPVKPESKVIKTPAGAYQVILIDKSGTVQGTSKPMDLQKAQASLAKLKGTEYNRSQVRPARRSLAARLIKGY